VGEVDDIQAELDRTDVSLVPIRVGAGTRLKVVEAMSNRIPLVSTPVGCEGIPLEDGVHALIADDPRRFADSCVRMVCEPALRQDLADAAAELFEASYTWESIERTVAELGLKVADST
jgi:glycosyltransferase involved in cell wall biosynthesis